MFVRTKHPLLVTTHLNQQFPELPNLRGLGIDLAILRVGLSLHCLFQKPYLLRHEAELLVYICIATEIRNQPRC